MQMKKLIKASIVSDESGHDYLIPEEIVNHFYKCLEESEYASANAIEDDWYSYEDFEEEFGSYRMEGDAEIYAYFESEDFQEG